MDELFARRGDDSLAPIQVERLSVEDEAALMGRGKGKQIAMGVTIAIACVLGGKWALDSLESRGVRADALAAARSADTQHAAAFLNCAFPGVPSARLASGEQLHNALERLSERQGKGYARVLERCVPELDTLVASLDAVRAPAELQPELRAVRAAAKELRAAVDALRVHLQELPGSYDYVQALPRMEKAGLTWAAYGKARAQLDRLAEAL